VRALVQRVSQASVRVDGREVGAIDQGLLVLLGVAPDDGEDQARWLARKLSMLRIFQDPQGRMNLSVQDVGGAALVVSQFTLYADCRRGNRPSFVRSAQPQLAEPLYERFCELLAEQGLRVERGVFGALMDITLVNHGPVTVVVDTP
jgi:D-tyrosyl-tRNA(Tyr) deacylase